MPSPELERLADLGHLKREPPSRAEVEGLVRSGAARLADARNVDLSPDGRFDLAYNAAHAFALAGLRLAGYRADKRYFVFQALTHTLGIQGPGWRVLVKCHELRNRTEYEGWGEVDSALLRALLEIAEQLHAEVRRVVRSEVE